MTKRTTAGRKELKVIEWYFYPEFAPKRLFKNKCVQNDLKLVTGKHYEVLSQASNAWSHDISHEKYAAQMEQDLCKNQPQLQYGHVGHQN